MCGVVQILPVQYELEVPSGLRSDRTILSPGHERSNCDRLFVSNSKLEAQDCLSCQGFGIPPQVEVEDVGNDGRSRCDSRIC